MKMNRTRLTALLLAILMLVGTAIAEITPSELEALVSDDVARERAAHAGETGVIHAVEIAELDAPRAGAAFDDYATIIGTLSNGGEARWKTPVIWADTSGRLIDTARAGQQCMPFITFFVPEGYELTDVNVQQNVNLTLPEFLIQATDKDGSLCFLEAPTTGLIFITGTLTVPGAKAAKSTGGKRMRPGDSGAGAKGVTQPEASLPPELMVHTNPETVKTYGSKYVGQLIEMVKNEVEPKAVNMLIDSFPVYKKALENGQLSSGIGFFVEKQDRTIAYIKCASLIYKNSGKLAGKAMRVVVNADFFAKWDDDKGEYVFNEDRRSDLEFTITHEILHATMYDLIPTGTLGVDSDGNKAPENKFPTWFTEGTATAVDNAYRYRRNDLLRLCVDLDRLATENVTAVSFTPDRIIQNYGQLKDRYDINGSAAVPDYVYTSGYLASVYLMQLASEHLHGDDHAPRTAYKSADMREGFNYILESLQGGQSLDQIVRAVSPADGSGNPIYAGLSDFQQRFLTAPDANWSAAFCASFLKYLESLGHDGQHSWGCILIDFDDMRETLFPDSGTPTDPLAYKIQDTGGNVTSDVPLPGTLGAGGATLPGDTDAAAKGETEGGPTDAGEVDATGAADVAAKGETEGGPTDVGEVDATGAADVAAKGETEPADAPGTGDDDAQETPESGEGTPAVEGDPTGEVPSPTEGDLPGDGTPAVEGDPTGEAPSPAEGDLPGDGTPAVEGDAVGTDPVEDGQIDDQDPAIDGDPVMDDDPTFDDDPVTDDDPVMDDDPTFDDDPVTDDDPVMNDDPTFDDDPVMDDDPVTDDDPVMDDDPVAHDDPVIDDPVRDDAPTIDDTPPVEAAPPAPEAPAPQEAPPVEEAPAAPENPTEQHDAE